MDTDSQLSTLSSQPLSASAAQLIPFQHHELWIKLDLAEQERAKELLSVVERIEKSEEGVLATCAIIAAENPQRRGWSKHNLKTLYYSWLATRDWRQLILGYKHDSSLPAEFVNHLKTLVLREHRSRKQAIAKIRTAWRAGEVVPGYGTWRQWFATSFPDRDVPAHFCGDYPAGWSERNLYNNMPSKAQHTLATKGRHALQKYIPTLERDPSKLRFMEAIVIDDFQTDVSAVHGREVVRVVGLLAQDIGTRTKLAVGFKPRIEGDQGQRVNITRQDMQFLIKSFFARYGLPQGYPVTIYVENASAAITAELEAALELYFHGQVRVVRMDVLNYKTLANGFVEKGGKPWLHGWVESGFNLMHNLAGSLPGQRGSRYDNAPGDLAAKEKYFRQLMAYETTAEQFAKFRHPFISFNNLVIAYEGFFEVMDNRTDHRMLGFDEVLEWRRGPGQPWQAFEQLALLSPEEQTQVEVRQRMQSPVERRALMLAETKFVKVPEPVLALLAFTAKPVVLRNHRVTFIHLGKGYSFAHSGSEVLKLPQGSELLAYFEETTMARIYCFSKEGGYVGEMKRLGGVDIKDPEAIAEAAAQLAHLVGSEIEKPVRDLLATDRAQAEADRAANDAVLIEAGHKPLSPVARLTAPRATNNDSTEDNKKPERRSSLSQTLARDVFAPAPEQFDAALQAASTIAAAALQQAEIKARQTPPTGPLNCDQNDLLGEAPRPVTHHSAPDSADEEPANPEDLID